MIPSVWGAKHRYGEMSRWRWSSNETKEAKEWTEKSADSADAEDPLTAVI
jgi:hypothetical protein